MFPDTIELIEEFDENFCKTWVEVLKLIGAGANGILNKNTEFVLGSVIRIYVKYEFSSHCKLELLKQDSSVLLSSNNNIAVTALPDHYYFDLELEDLGIKDNGVVWQDGDFILKLSSHETDEIFSLPVKLIRSTDERADKSDIDEIRRTLNDSEDERVAGIKF